MLTAVSLYTGIGGLDFGFEAAGFKTVVANDLDGTACDAIEQNRRWPVLRGAINDFGSRQILRAAGLATGEADVLVGGPPCQPFSKAAYWRTGDARRLDDPRAGTLEQYLRVLRDVLPKTFLLENVQGLAYKGKDEGLSFLLRGIEQINRSRKTHYTVSVGRLNAADFGVPQIRERVFLIGHREGRSFQFPNPTHAPTNRAAAEGLHPYMTAWDAIGDLPPDNDDPSLRMGGKWADLLPSIPEGENYLWHTPRGGGVPLFGWRTRYWSFLLKLAKRLPSWTIQAQPGPAIGPFHWDNRKLSAEELCRLQTFPDGLTFPCGRNEIQRLLGNAVPSLLAEVLAREIRRQLLGVPSRKPLQLLPERRATVPLPEATRRVPTKYRKLIGDHAEHPGTGLGTGALRRLTELERAA